MMNEAWQPTHTTEAGGRIALILVAPVLPGMTEAWRRWVQEMRELRRHEYEMSCRQHGISAEWFWVVAGRQGDMAVIAAMAAAPESILARMAESERPFDRWYLDGLQRLLGLHVKQHQEPTAELIWDWQRR